MPRVPPPRRPTVALLHWGDTIEDFLEDLDLSLSDFLSSVTGGWMFGYIDALASTGVDTVLVLVSDACRRPIRTRHAPTGARVVVLPTSPLHRLVRRLVPVPTAWDRTAAAGTHGARRLVALLAWNVVGYLATPPVRLARELRRAGCTALLCQEYESPRFDVCAVLGGLLGLRVVATFQGGDTSRTPAERLVRPHSVRAAHALIIGSERERRRVVDRYHVEAGRLVAAPNPLDTRSWTPPTAADRAASRTELGIPSEARVVVWHGRVDMHRKGLDVLMEAWASVCGTCGDVRLLLVGNGYDRRVLRERIDALPVPGSVHWVDEYVNDRERLRRLLAAGEVAVLPSRHEGFPVAPMEAMALGLPLVAADVPGIVELLNGGEAGAGLIVPREDPSALAAALVKLLRDGALRREWGAGARRRIETTFSLQAVGRQLRGALLPGETQSLTTDRRSG